MTTRSPKTRGSMTYSRQLNKSPILKPKDDWRVQLREHRILYGNYACDVLLLVENSYALSPAINDIIEQAEESTLVKFITPKKLIKFLVNTYTGRPDYDYFGLFEEAITELYDEYVNNNKLSPESYVHLIKLRILAYNEIIAHDRTLIKDLKNSLETEMRNMGDSSRNFAKRPDKRTTKSNTLDQRYLQAKAGRIPNFTEVRKIPTIYNTDYDEPEPENIYYILCGIYDSGLIVQLQRLNIAFLSLIEIGIEGFFLNLDEMVVDNLDEAEFDRMLSMRSFWRNLMQDKTDIPKIGINTCYIKYSIPDPNQHKPSFDNFVILLKNLSDFKRLYYHYFTAVRHLDVTEFKRPINLNSMNDYNSFLDHVPNECITIPLMLHALIDEVCVRVDNWKNEKMEHLKSTKKDKCKFHGGPVVQVKTLLREYECSHKKEPTIVKMPKPVAISYGNTLEYKNAHVPFNRHINTVDITLNELKKSLPLKLFEKIDARNTFDLLFYNYVFSKWSEQLSNVSVEELTLCVYTYLFTRGNFRKFTMPTVSSEEAKIGRIQECMFGVKKIYNEEMHALNVELNTSFLKINSSLQGDPINIFQSKNAHEDDNIHTSCDNLSQQYHTLAQELDPAAFIQMVNVAYNEYNHFDYKYFAPTDAILLRFHYTESKHTFNRKKESFFLRTPICFRDFCYKLLLQDSEWFLKQEKEYWKGVYIQREKEKEYLMQHPKVDDNYDPKDFIINGSIKHEAIKIRSMKKSSMKTDPKRKSTMGDDNSRALSIRKSYRKSRDSIFAGRLSHKLMQSVSIPQFEAYVRTKEYDFEIYNLGDKFYALEFDEILYHSVICVKYTKQKLPKEPLRCTFVVSSQDNSLVLHCDQTDILRPMKPLNFHITMTNDVVMVFSVPTPPVFHIDNRHIVVHKSNIDERRNSYTMKLDSGKSSASKFTKSSTDDEEARISELKNEVLQYLTIAMKEQLPVFKIISSRLHKYQYVKRVKSKLVLPIGNIYRRICCKPTLYKRLPKNQTVYEAKCVPYSDLVNKERTPIIWKWNCSMATGLTMETVQANIPNDFYIRQRYAIERRDLPSIEDEAYRCYLRCGIIMKFLKDGSIKTLSPDKTLSHYKYGYFSSNKNRVSKNNVMRDVRLKRQTNIIPLHAYKKNLTALEKQVRRTCKKYRKHLIDIAENYRFERSREDSRKMHKIYKLSKRIYTKDSHVIPLINHTVITSEGRYIDVRNNIVHDTFKKYEESRYRDYLLNETVTRRDDGTSWMIDSHGNAITQFPDGSRITTWYTILDENLTLNPEITAVQKRTVVVEDTESLTKFCQTVDDEYEENEEEDVEVYFTEKNNNNNMKDAQQAPSGFVLVGMNYSFEHPNYATVSYYCWEESSADILMPDKIKVTATADGTYKLKLINNDVINVNAEDVEFVNNNPGAIKQESCVINLKSFSTDKIKPERPFLTVKENNEKVFIITCDGSIEQKREFSISSSSCDPGNTLCTDRTFVMKRDLSGLEMLKEPLPYHFSHTLIDLKNTIANTNHENVIRGPTKFKIFHPLKKTYSEHQMMMYDIPILATTKEKLCVEKLWKLHDLDINMLIAKRPPLVIYERYLSCLPSEIILKELAQAVLKCIIEGNENLPNVDMIQDLVETAESVAKTEIVEVKVPEKKRAPRNLSCRKQIEKFKQLTEKNAIPPYFETIRGLMFLAVEECSEAAMEQSSGRREARPITTRARTLKGEKITSQTLPFRPIKRKTEYENIQEIEKKLDEMDNERINRTQSLILRHKSISRMNASMGGHYMTKLNMPDQMEIHLKPNAAVHEIILTSNGLQIITDKNLEENYYYQSQMDILQKDPSQKEGIKKLDQDQDQERRDSDLIDQLGSNIPSYFGEDIAGYFSSHSKIPSWDDSLCQKACINSLTTTTNTTTLVTVPKTNNKDTSTCIDDACHCSKETIQRLSKCCRCHKYYCNCKDTYSPFATCALQNQLNISEAVCVLATKIVQTVEKEDEKFNLFYSKLDNIIRDMAQSWGMIEPTTSDLIKTIRYILDQKIIAKNTIPEEQAMSLLRQVEATISKIKISRDAITLNIQNLQKMADLVVRIICNSKNNSNIAKEVRRVLRDAKIGRLDIIDTIKLAKEKMPLYYEHGLYPSNLSLPEIPPESKCCKIAQYIDYLLDNMLEGTCEKCNSSVHNTSPANYRSKESFEKISNFTTSSPIKNLSTKTPNNSKELISSFQEEIGPQYEDTPVNQLIVEPLFIPHTNSPVKQNDDEDNEGFDMSSMGGYSLVKSCQEIVDVSVPFMSKVEEKRKQDQIPIKSYVSKSESGVEMNPKLSKIDLPTNSKIKQKDIITILAPENQAEFLVNENKSEIQLCPLLRGGKNAEKTGAIKPIVYDGHIITKK